MHEATPANGPNRQTDWDCVNWRKANRIVRNLRQRIFRASQEGKHRKVHSLQKLMLRCASNRLLSVRRVTQVNAGKYTPGVDQVVVKTPAARGKLVDDLSAYQPWRAKPARRVYIPKTNGKLRPLGIPVVTDRCLQAMVKQALEPAWEARFEGGSYGFRPGRSCHDAMSRIHQIAKSGGTKPWVVDADIVGAFDHIDHEFLLRTIGPVPGRELIRQWLKARYSEDGVVHDTPAGTPQGGVISPLLANIALHGMETALGANRLRRQGALPSRGVVRYADDFVVFCETRDDAEACIRILTDWLKEQGLALSGEKTRIVHLTEGFDFLGFTVRRYQTRTTRSGYKLRITPSKTSGAKLRDRLRAEWRALRGNDVDTVLRRLNPIIRGWANYFRPQLAAKTFHDLDHWMFRREQRYTRRQHPRKSWAWRKARYWGKLNVKRRDTWVFGNKQTGRYLQKFGWTGSKRHILVRGTSSPDDPDLREYWRQRSKAGAALLRPSDRKIALTQDMQCPVCKESLFNGEEVHKHHRQPRMQGGTDAYRNLVLVHLYCHQQLTRRQRDLGLLEPGAVEVARPVLRGEGPP
jgi:RNA-directed DNA polymerase